jgi:polysaccharide export outer membrane protein
MLCAVKKTNNNIWNTFILRKTIPFILGSFLFLALPRKDVCIRALMEWFQKKWILWNKIQPDDHTSRLLFAEDPESVAAFNLDRPLDLVRPQVSDRKRIWLMPAAMTAYFRHWVGGLSRSGLRFGKVMVYVKPIINLRITNFKVSVQGEVASPVYINSLEELHWLRHWVWLGIDTLWKKK